jgi:hypothetical protein
VTRGVAWRLQGERLRRREAARCRVEGHPPAALFWQAGDFGTADARVCGRCWATLATRPHRPDPPPNVNPAGGAGANQEDE